MPRRKPPREEPPEPLDLERARQGVQGVQSGVDGDWQVRAIPAAAAVKSYRCPGCDQEIPPGTPHVVAWRADGDLGDRRHWHAACWRSRGRRTPIVQRSRSAPRYG